MGVAVRRRDHFDHSFQASGVVVGAEVASIPSEGRLQQVLGDQCVPTGECVDFLVSSRRYDEDQRVAEVRSLTRTS